ncbi:MAG: hypothetical protein SGARI_005137, partial [Bacillariaceae sp.]
MSSSQPSHEQDDGGGKLSDIDLLFKCIWPKTFSPPAPRRLPFDVEYDLGLKMVKDLPILKGEIDPPASGGGEIIYPIRLNAEDNMAWKWLQAAARHVTKRYYQAEANQAHILFMLCDLLTEHDITVVAVNVDNGRRVVVDGLYRANFVENDVMGPLMPSDIRQRNDRHSQEIRQWNDRRRQILQQLDASVAGLDLDTIPIARPSSTLFVSKDVSMPCLSQAKALKAMMKLKPANIQEDKCRVFSDLGLYHAL